MTLFILTMQQQAHAYLDPGTGSIIFQGLIAGLLASLFFIKTIWYRIMNFFGRGHGDDDPSAAQPLNIQVADEPIDKGEQLAVPDELNDK